MPSVGWDHFVIGFIQTSIHVENITNNCEKLSFSTFCLFSVVVHALCFDQRLTESHLSFLAANEEYYQLLMINDSQPSGLDVSSYTIEEIDSITSEYTLKNNVSHWIMSKQNKNTLTSLYLSSFPFIPKLNLSF